MGEIDDRPEWAEPDAQFWEDPRRVRLSVLIMEAVEGMIGADDPTFAPLYRQRKAFMLEQGYAKGLAEQEAREFVAREFLAALWCEGHNKQWIPADPRDPHAHEQEPLHPDKGIA